MRGNSRMLVVFYYLDTGNVGVLFMKNRKAVHYTCVYISVCMLYFNKKVKK